MRVPTFCSLRSVSCRIVLGAYRPLLQRVSSRCSCCAVFSGCLAAWIPAATLPLIYDFPVLASSGCLHLAGSRSSPLRPAAPRRDASAPRSRLVTPNCVSSVSRSHLTAPDRDVPVCRFHLVAPSRDVSVCRFCLAAPSRGVSRRPLLSHNWIFRHFAAKITNVGQILGCCAGARKRICA